MEFYQKSILIYLTMGNLVTTSQGWTTHANTQKPRKTLLETSRLDSVVRQQSKP